MNHILPEDYTGQCRHIFIKVLIKYC